MDPESPLKLIHTKQCIEAIDADLSGSTFTDVNLAGVKLNDVNLTNTAISNANMTGLRVNNANLAGASIVDCVTKGMTIDGVAVSDLFAAYRLADK